MAEIYSVKRPPLLKDSNGFDLSAKYRGRGARRLLCRLQISLYPTAGIFFLEHEHIFLGVYSSLEHDSCTSKFYDCMKFGLQNFRERNLNLEKILYFVLRVLSIVLGLQVM